VVVSPTTLVSETPLVSAGPPELTPLNLTAPRGPKVWLSKAMQSYLQYVSISHRGVPTGLWIIPGSPADVEAYIENAPSVPPTTVAKKNSSFPAAPLIIIAALLAGAYAFWGSGIETAHHIVRYVLDAGQSLLARVHDQQLLAAHLSSVLNHPDLTNGASSDPKALFAMFPGFAFLSSFGKERIRARLNRLYMASATTISA
jgi:hypothetical protein